MAKKAAKRDEDEVAARRGEEFEARRTRDIGWYPFPDNMGCPLTTFGRALHDDNLVELPEIGATGHFGLDPGIADLVIALNRAGIKTIQSCQEITEWCDNPDVVRMGIVLVDWESWPRVAATLPTYADPATTDHSGWLFLADPHCEYVSVIFPLRDHDDWLAEVNQMVPEASANPGREALDRFLAGDDRAQVGPLAN